MQQPLQDERSKVVIRIEVRRVHRRVPGIGPAVFRGPSVADDEILAHSYAADVLEHRAFVNEVIALLLMEPKVEVSDVNAWTERARAIARVAVAEVAGCTSAYRRLAGSGLSGDERLYRAMRTRRERGLADLAQAMRRTREDLLHTLVWTQTPFLDFSVFSGISEQMRRAVGADLVGSLGLVRQVQRSLGPHRYRRRRSPAAGRPPLPLLVPFCPVAGS